nr:uncharacterized protein LOC129283385 [Lytechinus pictus]
MAQDRSILIGMLVCCLAVVSIVALVLGIISLNSQQGMQGGSRTTNGTQSINIYNRPATESTPDSSDDKIWLFAIGHYDDVRQYLDESTYTIKGFTPDIVDVGERI